MGVRLLAEAVERASSSTIGALDVTVRCADDADASVDRLEAIDDEDGAVDMDSPVEADVEEAMLSEGIPKDRCHGTADSFVLGPCSLSSIHS